MAHADLLAPEAERSAATLGGIESRNVPQRQARASRLGTTDTAAARINTLTVFGLMIGTLQLAGPLTDRDLSDQLLARGTETALNLLDDSTSSIATT
jgi:TetR/AcrR family transcriptional repressor of nem operon